MPVTRPARYHGMPPHPGRLLRMQLRRDELGSLPVPRPGPVCLRASPDHLPRYAIHYLRRARAGCAHAAPQAALQHPLLYTPPRVLDHWSYEPALATPRPNLPHYPGAPHP